VVGLVRAGRSTAGSDPGVLFGVLKEKAIFGANMPAARRHSKNSGGGIAPAAIDGLIKGALCSVNAFRAFGGRETRLESADKVLMRLNFPGRPGNG
jgi:hypothetical protein